MDEQSLPHLPRAQSELSAIRRELDARGINYVVVNGMAVVAQGFSRPEEELDLHVQCSELNRQAVVRTLVEIAGRPPHDT